MFASSRAARRPPRRVPARARPRRRGPPPRAARGPGAPSRWTVLSAAVFCSASRAEASLVPERLDRLLSDQPIELRGAARWRRCARAPPPRASTAAMSGDRGSRAGRRCRPLARAPPRARIGRGGGEISTSRNSRARMDCGRSPALGEDRHEGARDHEDAAPDRDRDDLLGETEDEAGKARDGDGREDGDGHRAIGGCLHLIIHVEDLAERGPARRPSVDQWRRGRSGPASGASQTDGRTPCARPHRDSTAVRCRSYRSRATSRSAVSRSACRALEVPAARQSVSSACARFPRASRERRGRPRVRQTDFSCAGRQPARRPRHPGFGPLVREAHATSSVASPARCRVRLRDRGLEPIAGRRIPRGCRCRWWMDAVAA
jgi:hypothetical protein